MRVLIITTHWIPIFLTLGLFAFSKVLTLTPPRNMEEENVPLMFAEAVQGTEGRLPCNVTPPMSDDRVILVIWYKEGYTTPVYSFDIRDSKFEKGRHWFDEESLGGRAFFEAGALPATLNIKSIRSTDTGIYRCRVDFVKSPTRNSRVQLTVIIPPEELRILDEKGTYIPHYILGPYNEGSSINVTCVSLGGRPLPNVTWWHENTLLDATSTILSDNRVKNVLNLDKLKRNNLNMVLTCQASNNNITTAITSSVTLDMNLRPLWVKLQGENRPLSAESSYELWCEVVGSRPSPSITWWKGSIQMRNTREITSTDGNTTQSILTYTPTIDDRGKFLSCRAEQTLISDSGIENGWKLDIYHIPVVTLEFGTNYNTSSIREGADVYFECNIKSNPWIYKVSWRHNGKNLDNSIPDGIIVANQSLVLQNVSRARSGLYTCIGSNREGDGESNAVQLDIKFAPICKPGQINLYNAGRQEIIRVACDLDANPTDVQFTWKFNATNLESIDIAASLIQTDKSRSIVAYTPMTEHDYGSLLCWGANEIGVQTDPCIFSIIPAGRPDSLTNCSVLNQTSNTFQIECLEGFDGGLEQSFVVELYPTGTRQLIASIKSKIPYFELKGLDAGMGYDIILAAMNKKGRSDLTILQAYTLKNPEKQTDLTLAYSPAIEHMKPFLGTLLGIVGALLLIAVIIVIVVQMRGSNGRDRNNCPSHTRQETIPRNGQLFNELGQESCNDSVDSIEKNPDVIPQENKNEDRDEDETAFEWTHPRMYATQVVADQQNGMKTGYGVSEKQNIMPQQQTPTQFPVQIPTHPSYYTAVIPATSLGYNKILPPISRDLTYADLSVAQQAKPFFSSATLGRPRQSELKRTEPTIYAQIDLAHHLPHPMYSTSTMYGTNTGVTMSHPSQMTTFPPPPLFASQNISPMPMPPNSMNTSIVPMCGNSTNQPTLLQMVPEGKILSQPTQQNIDPTSIPTATTSSSGILIKGNGTTIGDRNINSTTRF